MIAIPQNVNKYCGWVRTNDFSRDDLIDLGCSGKMILSHDGKIIEHVEATPKVMEKILEHAYYARAHFTAVDESGVPYERSMQIW